MSKAAINRFLAKPIARHDEGSGTATAEAKRTERYDDAELK